MSDLFKDGQAIGLLPVKPLLSAAETRDTHRTGWSWSSGAEDLRGRFEPRGPVLDFSREIKMPSVEVGIK